MSDRRLALRNVSATLGGRAAASSVTADFDSGGLVALVGPNGAGKTTLLRAMMGLLPFTGEIHILGESASKLGAGERARRIGYLPQGHTIHWPLPARDIVALGRFAHGARDPSRLPTGDAKAVDDAMEATGTTAFADRPVTELSGGERARIALARVLATETPIVLADEPATSLDPRYQIAVMTLLRKIADSGRLVIVVLHDLALAWRFADRALVMNEGKIAIDAAPTVALAPDVLAAVFGVRTIVTTHGDASLLAVLETIE